MVMKVICCSIKHRLKYRGFKSRIYGLDMNLEVCSIYILTQYMNGKALS